jgi:hypothetical protein
MNFDNIDYLEFGNKRQQQAYATLTNHQIMSKLKPFDPILVGTIPINIDIESSDLDIICYFTDIEDFQNKIKEHFSTENKFKFSKEKVLDTMSVIANFYVDGFEIEIFGQNTPTKQQFAYRHMMVEYHLLNQHGEQLRQTILDLKRKGYKTEPAFAKALNLEGDPYLALFNLIIP